MQHHLSCSHPSEVSHVIPSAATAALPATQNVAPTSCCHLHHYHCGHCNMWHTLHPHLPTGQMHLQHLTATTTGCLLWLSCHTPFLLLTLHAPPDMHTSSYTCSKPRYTAMVSPDLHNPISTCCCPQHASLSDSLLSWHRYIQTQTHMQIHMTLCNTFTWSHQFLNCGGESHRS